MSEKKKEEKPKMFRKDGGKPKGKKKLKFSEIISKIEEKITIPELVELSHGRAECPEFGNTSAPSLEYFETTSSFYCFKCQRGGNVINLFAIQNKLTFGEALFQLANKFKIQIEEQSKEEVELREKILKLYEILAEMCYRNLLDSKYYQFVMEKRGFSENVIKEYKIGYFNDSIKSYLL